MTSTDIATIEQPSADDAMSRLQQWVGAAQQAHQLVGPLVESAFVPENYRPRVDPRASDEEKAYAREIAVANATSAVLLGLNLGLDPLTALQQIVLIKNRPSMYAKAKVAILTSRGYEIWTEDLTDDHAVICVVRPGSDRVEKFEVTMAQAKRAGWTSNDNYAKTPQDMLYARAAARACDRTGAHILLGIPTVEDVRDIIEVQAEAGTPRLTRADIIDGHEEPGPAAAPSEPAPPIAPEMMSTPISASQERKMKTQFGKLGVTDRGQRVEIASVIIDRDIASASELTFREATQVTDELDRRIAEAEAAAQQTGLEADVDGAWPAAAQPADAS